MAIKLRCETDPRWTQVVLDDFDAFLVDHAAAERKASATAMQFVAHYPDRQELVVACTHLAIEELVHFRQVVKILHNRGLILQADRKDSYVAALHKRVRRGTEFYFLDRLLLAAVVEARGHERFSLLASALVDDDLSQFYREISQSEFRHQDLFVEMARRYFAETVVARHLEFWLDQEAEIISAQLITAALH